jgi:hypothetical protein
MDVRTAVLVLGVIYCLGSPVVSFAIPPTEVQIVDGMTLDLAENALQQVRVRLKSFGPGACAVTVSIDGESKTIVAPLFHFTDWTPVGPAEKGGSHKLKFHPDCSTGAMGYVQYEQAFARIEGHWVDHQYSFVLAQYEDGTVVSQGGGGQAKGSFVGVRTFTLYWPATKLRATGTLNASGQAINWNNGVVWRRP